jgi:prepilin-type N-terminal cleavage/methylation domain-containing protein
MKGITMQCAPAHRSRARGFTIVELLVVVAIIALLIGILLPAIQKARDTAQMTASKGNIRNIMVALENYSNDWGTQFNVGPENLAGGHASRSRTGMSLNEAIIAWNDVYDPQCGSGGEQPIGMQLGMAQSGATYYVYNRMCHYNWVAAPITFRGGQAANVNFSEYGGGGQYDGTVNGLGYFRYPNALAVAEYISGSCYDSAYFAPKDKIVLDAISSCKDEQGSYCPTDGQPDAWNSLFPVKAQGVGYMLVPSSYCLSPSALYHPMVFKYDEDLPNDGFRDPMTIGSAFKTPSVAQCKFPSQKTWLMEHHWLNNNATDLTECGVNFDYAAPQWNSPTVENGLNYDGCEPWYFNASFKSAPITMFYDGHVDVVPMAGAERDDKYVRETRGTDSGTWHRSTPDGVNAYFHDGGSDWTDWSGHTHTCDGIRGKDILAGSDSN